jgi:hypothetical protein
VPAVQTLCHTPPDAALALSVAGRSLPSAHASLVAILGSRLGQAHRDLLATPVVDAQGTRWTTALPGEALPASSLPEDERQRLQRRVEQLRGDIRGLGRQMRGESATGEVVGTMLEQATQQPAGDWLYSVGGKPVLVLWGHTAAGEAVDTPIAGANASTTPALAASAAASSTATHAPMPAMSHEAPIASEASTSSTRRHWPWLTLLLGIGLIAAALFGLRACQPEPDDGLAERLARADEEARQLEAELARRRAQQPRFICAAPPPEPVASAPEPPVEVASAPEPEPPPAPPSAQIGRAHV